MLNQLTGALHMANCIFGSLCHYCLLGAGISMRSSVLSIVYNCSPQRAPVVLLYIAFLPRGIAQCFAAMPVVLTGLGRRVRGSWLSKKSSLAQPRVQRTRGEPPTRKQLRHPMPCHGPLCRECGRCRTRDVWLGSSSM